MVAGKQRDAYWCLAHFLTFPFYSLGTSFHRIALPHSECVFPWLTHSGNVNGCALKNLLTGSNPSQVDNGNEPLHNPNQSDLGDFRKKTAMRENESWGDLNGWQSLSGGGRGHPHRRQEKHTSFFICFIQAGHLTLCESVPSSIKVVFSSCLVSCYAI